MDNSAGAALLGAVSSAPPLVALGLCVAPHHLAVPLPVLARSCVAKEGRTRWVQDQHSQEEGQLKKRMHWQSSKPSRLTPNTAHPSVPIVGLC